MKTLDRILTAVTLSGALICAAPARAEVAAYSNDATLDRPVLVLESNKLTDDGDPGWAPHSEDYGDGRVRVLNEEGSILGDGRPSVVIHPASREAVVAWSRLTESGYDIVISRFVAGDWTEPVTVAAGSADELDPQLIVAPADGGLHLLYWVNDTLPRVELRSTTGDATSWSAPEAISGPAEPGARPHGVVAGGQLLVTFEVHAAGLGATPRQIVVARREGETWTSQVAADTFHPEPNRPEIHARGARVWIEWVDGPGEMRWTSRQDQGAWQPLELETFDGLLDREYHVRGRVAAAVRSAE